jgi:hypothetical protein
VDAIRFVAAVFGIAFVGLLLIALAGSRLDHR